MVRSIESWLRVVGFSDTWGRTIISQYCPTMGIPKKNVFVTELGILLFVANQFDILR